MKVRGACDNPFGIYKRLNNCAAPAPGSDDVLVVASLACPTHKNASSSTTKTSSLSGARGGGGGGNYSIADISKSAFRMHLGPSPFNSAPRTLRDMKLSFWMNFPFKKDAVFVAVVWSGVECGGGVSYGKRLLLPVVWIVYNGVWEY